MLETKTLKSADEEAVPPFPNEVTLAKSWIWDPPRGPYFTCLSNLEEEHVFIHSAEALANARSEFYRALGIAAEEVTNQSV